MNLSTNPRFCFVWDAANQGIGFVYRDCGLDDLYKFAPFSHGLSDLIHGISLEETKKVLDAFQLKTCPGGLEALKTVDELSDQET